jgi:hypothetical protein
MAQGTLIAQPQAESAAHGGFQRIVMTTQHESADRLWRGEDRTTGRAQRPFALLYQIEEMTRNVAFYTSFSNLANEQRVQFEPLAMSKGARRVSMRPAKLWPNEVLGVSGERMHTNRKQECDGLADTNAQNRKVAHDFLWEI